MNANPSTNRTKDSKGYRGPGMEGFMARWYARTTIKNLADYRRSAGLVAARVQPGASVLEVAPGPGYTAIELAKLGNYQITGLDISESFVRMAVENARMAGVAVDFRHGNVSAMPFESNTFDFIYCRAAFKNFSEPVEAIREMHRVLKPGGKALIHDLRPDASPEAIHAEVKKMGLGLINSLIVRFTLRMLMRRAHSAAKFEEMAAQTPFGGCEITGEPIGFAISLAK
jgi:ubiquinone/menaquinone biosynthesis C-methylase UbiE